MYEIHRTQGIKAKKYSIWLGSDEVVRSQSKVAVEKLLVHLNGEPNVRTIPTDLREKSGELGSTDHSSTTTLSGESDELRDGDKLRCLDQEFEKFLSGIDQRKIDDGVAKREREREFEVAKRERDREFEVAKREREREFEVAKRERDREFEVAKRERERRYAEQRKRDNAILDLVSELADLSQLKLRRLAQQNQLPCSSITSEVRRLEPLTIDVEAIEPTTIILHVHGTETSEYP